MAIGKESMGKPAPRVWRKFEDGMLMIIIPTTVAIVMGWGFDNEVLVTRVTLMVNVGLVALIKFIGKMISNGEVYAKGDSV